MPKTKREKTCLFLILLGALFFRVFHLSTNPPELFEDEIANVVSPLSILQTGKDLNGRIQPYFYRRLDLFPPIYGWFASLSVLIFGKSPVSIRLPAVIWGLVTVFILYLLVKLITKSTTVALFASGTLAILPWAIHYSRLGWEPAVLLPFLLISIFLFLKGVKENKKTPFLLSFIFFGLTIYTYHGAPLFSLLFLSFLLLLKRKRLILEKRALLAGLVIYFLLTLPFLVTAHSEPLLLARAKRVSTFSLGLNNQSLETFFRNYLAHFSLSFLFVAGDPNLRHGYKGKLYFWMLPAILVGLLKVLKTKNYERGLLLFWLLIYPLGGAITNDGVPHSHRTLIGAPVFAILSAIGLREMILWMKKRRKAISFLAIFGLLSFFELLNFIKGYYYYYPYESQKFWYYGQSQIFSFLKENENSYQRACLSNLGYYGEETYKAYYLKDSPLKILINVDNPDCQKRSTILVLSSDRNPPANFDLVRIIKDLYGQPLYQILVS